MENKLLIEKVGRGIGLLNRWIVNFILINMFIYIGSKIRDNNGWFLCGRIVFYFN